MAVPGVEDADAAGEIDIALTFHVPDLGILGARREYLRHHADAARGRLLLAALPLLVEIQSIHDVASSLVERELDALQSAAPRVSIILHHCV